MNSNERHKARYERRKAKRQKRREDIVASIGDEYDVFTFHDMFKYGDECCKGVMWKQSAQSFHRHMFSRTAVNRRRALDCKKPKPLYRFTIYERGKVRHIEAPHIDDRQIHKTFTKKVLLPLYLPRMINDNGASLKDKGLFFSQGELDKAIKRHIRQYGMNGWIIIADLKGFFPNADRDIVKRKHDEIKSEGLRNLLNITTDAGGGDKGLPLGVEPSQVEMISLPSPLDSYMSCQLGLRGFGHYMDDYHIIVPPDIDPVKVLDIFEEKAKELGMIVSRDKTQIIPIGKPFKYCKMKRIFVGDKIVKRGSRASVKRARRKIKKFARTKMEYEDIYTSVSSILAYFTNTDDHNTMLELRRLFYKLFGFSCEDVDNFRKRVKKYGVYLPQKI